jgi:tetratricopeptide (TPR) repeat protein
MFWTARNEIEHFTAGMEMPHLAVSSTPEEWGDMGKELFQNKRYLQAMHCFERANQMREKAVANAYYLREQARLLPIISPRQSEPRSVAFVKTAEAFLDCANSASKDARTYFSNAADCFESGGDIRRAAKAFLDAENFTRAVQLYRKEGMFDEALQVIQGHGQTVDANVSESVINVARLYYFKEQELEYVSQKFRPVIR